MTKKDLEDKILYVIREFEDLDSSIIIEDIELVRLFRKGKTPKTTGILIRLGKKRPFTKVKDSK